MKTIKIVALFMITCMFILTYVFYAYSENICNGLSENLVRLHIIANSDSKEDQSFKLEVRNVVLDYMKSKFKNTETKTASKEIIKKELGNIENIVKDEIKKRNFSYGAKAEFGNFNFPTKVYGNIALPEGNYEAVRITLGNGDGKNWWCVLFPPLCLVDATHGEVSSEFRNDMKKVLTEEEYDLVNMDSKEEIPVEVKFKIVEVFQDSRIKVKGMINKMFN